MKVNSISGPTYNIKSTNQHSNFFNKSLYENKLRLIDHGGLSIASGICATTSCKSCSHKLVSPILIGVLTTLGMMFLLDKIDKN